MKRRVFLSDLGALAAMACTCQVVSCTKPYTKRGSRSLSDLGNEDALSASVDLGTELINPYDSIRRNGIIIVRLLAGNSANCFTALHGFCTYEKVLIAYSAFQGLFYCSTHGCRFSTTGAIIRGPAVVPVRSYIIKVNGPILTAG